MNGYTRRDELVYQLKRALNQVVDFDLETPIRHLLVDEYQDLNRCDLAVIRAIEEQGAEVFVAGDDDQSIYGFRKAHPEGIRRFVEDYIDARELPLELCMRCDAEILDLADFVARLDPDRIPKTLRAQADRIGGEVALLHFRDQYEEAGAVATMCRALVDAGHPQGEILILLRSDRHQAFSQLLVDRLADHGIPVATQTGGTPLENEGGQQVLAFLRLLANPEDHLAWRTLVQQRRNRLGVMAISQIHDQCRTTGKRFASAVQWIADNPQQVSRFGQSVKREVETVKVIVDQVGEGLDADADTDDLTTTLRLLGEAALENEDLRERVVDYLCQTAEEAEATTISELLGALMVSNENIEQMRDTDKVNILTMHQAKGLTAESVFVVGVEDERLPGRNEAEPDLGDERRLLFVSLTRARHRLFITFCNQRRYRQKNFGRETGTTRRTLTRFLRDAPLGAQPGVRFAGDYASVPRARE